MTDLVHLRHFMVFAEHKTTASAPSEAPPLLSFRLDLTRSSVLEYICDVVAILPLTLPVT